jgi:hypothetical protein
MLIKLLDLLSISFLINRNNPHLTCGVHGEIVTSSTLNPNKSTLGGLEHACA